MRNTKEVDEKVKVTKEEGAIGGYRYDHPSYGRVQLHRGSGSDRELFGSDVSHRNSMTLTISSADVRQDLGRSWYHTNNTIVEVEMSEVQYATMISSPNTEGVPCTIRYTKSDGYINFKPHTKQIEYTELKIQKVAENLGSVVESNLSRVKELMGKKTALNKAEKAEILGLFTKVKKVTNSSLPYYQECLKKSIDEMKVEAKSEMDAYVNNVMLRLGEKTAGNLDAISMLLLDNKNK